MTDYGTGRRAKSATSSLGKRINFAGWAVIAGSILLWEAFCQTWGTHLDTIASGTQISIALHHLLVDGPLIGQLLHTCLVSIAGWAIACVLGVAIGLIVGVWRPVWSWTMASIDTLRSIPSVCIASISLLVFGFSWSMEAVVIIYVSQWPVMLATSAGVGAVPGSLVEVARALRLSQTATILKILIPAALPNILVGMRLALTLSIAMAIVAEMVGNPEGLGLGLVSSQQAARPADAFAYLVVTGVLGWASNAGFGLITGAVLRGHGPVS